MGKPSEEALLELGKRGFKARTVSIMHLSAVQDAVASLVRQEMISETLHRDWHFYLDTNRDLPAAKTIFVVAIPQPVARAWFEWRSILYPADFPPGTFACADESRAGEIIGSVLKSAGHSVVKAHLALKTLAVRSGLARYGRNNITRVPGVGTFHRLVAFYSDCSCETDSWHEIRAMEACGKCSLCRESCPANSILTDRFLIRAENCRAFSNDAKDASWLGNTRRNTLVGCMVCQNVCPQNRPHLNKRANGPTFTTAETELILNGRPCNELAAETQRKLDSLAEGELYAALVQNLRCILKNGES